MSEYLICRLKSAIHNHNLSVFIYLSECVYRVNIISGIRFCRLFGEVRACAIYLLIFLLVRHSGGLCAMSHIVTIRFICLYVCIFCYVLSFGGRTVSVPCSQLYHIIIIMMVTQSGKNNLTIEVHDCLLFAPFIFIFIFCLFICFWLVICCSFHLNIMFFPSSLIYILRNECLSHFQQNVVFSLCRLVKYLQSMQIPHLILMKTIHLSCLKHIAIYEIHSRNCSYRGLRALSMSHSFTI